ncbi:hypothetical protein [Marinococcus sp. PL1-022]|uniref:hypothetical protein n=1 Tax=Marinococcus sp. PL1-022 TaxID=3095363 RepID=UPI002605F081|nr:hypothetical protein [Marinococcus sp. PL1-022]MDX6153261.1 hypothetical protein [Marinococcus sp. PL1-022]
MQQALKNPIATVVLGLAILGVGYRLVTDPLGLLLYLVIGAAIAVGLYFLFTRVIMKRAMMNQYQAGSNAASGRSGAAKGTQAKNFKQAQKQQKKKSAKNSSRRRNDANLKVIQGNKNRKKDRA